MYVVVIYDISCNETRSRLANYLKTKGFTRIQKSAFIGRPTPGVLRDVERMLPRFIEDASDVIHLIPILEYSIQHMKVYGRPMSEITVDRKLQAVY